MDLSLMCQKEGFDEGYSVNIGRHTVMSETIEAEYDNG